MAVIQSELDRRRDECIQLKNVLSNQVCGFYIRTLTQQVAGLSAHSTNICVHERVFLYWVWVFSMHNMYVIAKKL
jgi:hypothetical protein